MLPIFSTDHLRHFVSHVVDVPNSPARYYSLGEEYEYLTSELLTAKEKLLITKPWEITYFARFLYNNYPPPGREFTTLELSEGKRNRHLETKEQTEMRAFAELLQELQSKQKIDGIQFRDLRDQWTKQPDDREALTQRLKKQLNT